MRRASIRPPRDGLLRGRIDEPLRLELTPERATDGQAARCYGADPTNTGIRPLDIDFQEPSAGHFRGWARSLAGMGIDRSGTWELLRVVGRVDRLPALGEVERAAHGATPPVGWRLPRLSMVVEQPTPEE